MARLLLQRPTALSALLCALLRCFAFDPQHAQHALRVQGLGDASRYALTSTSTSANPAAVSNGAPASPPTAAAAAAESAMLTDPDGGEAEGGAAAAAAAGQQRAVAPSLPRAPLLARHLVTLQCYDAVAGVARCLGHVGRLADELRVSGEGPGGGPCWRCVVGRGGGAQCLGAFGLLTDEQWMSGEGTVQPQSPHHSVGQHHTPARDSQAFVPLGLRRREIARIGNSAREGVTVAVRSASFAATAGSRSHLRRVVDVLCAHAHRALSRHHRQQQQRRQQQRGEGLEAAAAAAAAAIVSGRGARRSGGGGSAGGEEEEGGEEGEEEGWSWQCEAAAAAAVAAEVLFGAGEGCWEPPQAAVAAAGLPGVCVWYLYHGAVHRRGKAARISSEED